MPVKFIFALKSFFLALVLQLNLSTVAFGQISLMNSQSLKDSIQKGVEYSYNLEFEKALPIYNYLHKTIPIHPATPLYYALMIYWQHFPLTPISNKSQPYIDSLLQCVRRSEALLEKDENNAEGVFFNMISRLMIMQYYADNGLSGKVISHVAPVYKMSQKGIKLMDSFVDFYYSSGIYNYYREAYPEVHSVYKPIAFFFPDGDKKKGLSQLAISAEKGIFMRAESLSFLTYIYLYFEKNQIQALHYTNRLVQRFPKNPQFVSYHIQVLLLQKQYKNALPYIDKLAELSKKNPYFAVHYTSFSGIIKEKAEHNFKKAEDLYIKAIALSEPYGAFVKNHTSYAYFGLSRIYRSKGENKKAAEFRNIAEDISAFPEVNFD